MFTQTTEASTEPRDRRAAARPGAQRAAPPPEDDSSDGDPVLRLYPERAFPPLALPRGAMLRRAAAAPPLTRQEQELHAQEQDRLHVEVVAYLEGRGRDWLLGRFLLEAAHHGYWSRDPSHDYPDFLTWARHRCAIGSQTVLDRLLLIASSYKLERFIALLKAGACRSALEEVARAPAELRPQLEDRAAAGASVEELRAVSKRLRVLLKGRVMSAEELEAELSAEAARHLKKAAQETAAIKMTLLLLRQTPEGDPSPETGQEAAAEAARRSHALRLQEEALRAERDAVAAEKAALAAEKAALDAERAAQREQETKTDRGPRPAEPVAFARPAEPEATSAALTDLEPLLADAERSREVVVAVLQERDAQQHRGAALDQRAAALADQQRHLDQRGERQAEQGQRQEQRLQELTQQATDQLTREAVIHERGRQVDARERALDDRAGALAQQADELQREALRLAARAQELEAQAQQSDQEALQQQADRRDLDLRGEETALRERELQQEAEAVAASRDVLRELEEAMEEAAAEEALRKEERQQAEDALAERALQVRRCEVVEGRMPNPLLPSSVDEATLLLEGLTAQCQRVLNHLVEHLSLSRGHRPERGGTLRLMILLRRSKLYWDGLMDRSRELIEEAGRCEPEQVKEELEEFHRRAAEGQLGLQDDLQAKAEQEARRQAGPRQDRAFALPVAAVLGSKVAEPAQRAVLGVTLSGGELVLMDQNRPAAVTILGVQDSGKSNTVRVMIENATESMAGLNVLPQPAAAIVLHRPEVPGQMTELVSSLAANDELRADGVLSRLQVKPRALGGRLIVLTDAKDERELRLRRSRYPRGRTQVDMLSLPPGEVNAEDLRTILMAGHGAPIYLQTLDDVLRALPPTATATDVAEAIKVAPLKKGVRDYAEQRWNRLVARVVRGGTSFLTRLRPGDRVVIDIQSQELNEEEVGALFSLVLGVASRNRERGSKALMLVIVLDEAHRYMHRKSALGRKLVRLIRQMRHLGLQIILATQDPSSVPLEVISLSTITMVHRLPSEKEREELIKGDHAWRLVSAQLLAEQTTGMAMVRAKNAFGGPWVHGPAGLLVRESLSRPGGTTQLVVPE